MRGTKFNKICSEVDDHSEVGGVEEGACELEDGVLKVKLKTTLCKGKQDA